MNKNRLIEKTTEFEDFKFQENTRMEFRKDELFHQSQFAK